MKAKDLLKAISALDPEENICVLWWEKPADDEDTVLTNEAWAEICTEFNEYDNAGQDVSEWIADAVIEKSEEKK